ncbi:MAG: replication initiation protein [Bacillus sp. (in: firmicutes)]|uniref:replication initiation protein n=1 Tax=Bacillus sp. TaxID=1409 RepID=UPI0039E23720
MKHTLQIKETNIVSKSNTLIEANYRLNLVEQKILLCLASNIEPKDRDFKTYTFPIKQFHELLGLHGSTKYSELSKITKKLMSKVMEIRLGDEIIQVSWLSAAIYNKNRGTIDMRFDPLLKPFFLELSNKFTSYRLANVVKLKSTYAIRIYELLKQYENLRERVISLENLRYYLDAMNIYPSYANFKQRILSPSKKELDLKTDISFKFEEIKSGRKVTKIKFIIYGKNQEHSDIGGFEKKLTQFQKPNTFEHKIKQFEDRYNDKVPSNIFEKWKRNKEIVLEIIDEMRFRENITSPIGYIEYMLKSKKKTSNYGNLNLETDAIIDKIINQYAKTTGTIATFLVKDTAIKELTNLVNYKEAEVIWEQAETFIMDKIYAGIKKNKLTRRF